LKLTAKTINILKNFATINGNLLLKPGSVITTLSAAKSVFATAKVPDVFETTFGIYDLQEFLGAMSLYTDPEVIFDEKVASIKSGKSKIKFFSADPVVLTVPTKELNLPEPDIKFSITAEQIGMIMKTSGVLHSSDVAIVGDGETLSFVVGDKKNKTGNSSTIEIGSTDKKFNAYFKIDNMKFMPDDYNVGLSSKKVATFTTPDGDLNYVLSMEADSTFSI